MFQKTAALLAAAALALPALARNVPPEMESARQTIASASAAFLPFFAKRYPAAFAYDKTCGRIAVKGVEYCMRPAYARLVKAPSGLQTLSVIFAGEVTDPASQSFPEAAESVPGMMGFFLGQSEDGKHWKVSRHFDAIPIGTHGRSPLRWTPMKVGPETESLVAEGALAGGGDDRHLFFLYSSQDQVVLSPLRVYSNRGQGTQRGCLKLKRSEQDACLKRVHEVRAEIRPATDAKPAGGLWPLEATVTHYVKDKRWKPERFRLPYDPAQKFWVWPKNSGLR